MTDSDAKLKLVREIERAADSYGTPLKPGLAVFIATKLLADIPALLEAVKQGTRGKVT